MRIEPADAAMFREQARWHYDPPYDFYDDDDLPVKNPENFFAVRDDDGSLVGFYYFEPLDGALFYGFGLRPDWTGQGRGEQFVRDGLAFARPRYRPPGPEPWVVVLDVAAFNRRAITVYRRVGFVETGRHFEPSEGYGPVEFVDMELVEADGP